MFFAIAGRIGDTTQLSAMTVNPANPKISKIVLRFIMNTSLPLLKIQKNRHQRL